MLKKYFLILVLSIFTATTFANTSEDIERGYKTYKIKVKSIKYLSRMLAKYKKRIPSQELLKSLNKDKIKIVNGKKRISVKPGDTFILPIKIKKEKTSVASTENTQPKSKKYSNDKLLSPVTFYLKSGGGDFTQAATNEDITQSQFIPYSFAVETTLFPNNKYRLNTELGIRPLTPAQTSDGGEISAVTEYYLSGAVETSYKGFNFFAPIEYETLNDLVTTTFGITIDRKFEAVSFASLGLGASKDLTIFGLNLEVIASYNFLFLSDYSGSKIKGALKLSVTERLSIVGALSYYSLSSELQDSTYLRYNIGVGYSFF